MPEPMSSDNYDNVKDVTKVIAENSRADAAKEVKGRRNICFCWWHMAEESRCVIVTSAISVDTGKVLDCAIMSKSCKGWPLLKILTMNDVNDGKHHINVI